jgi:RND family efflux transporter MFP subunit
MNRKLILTVVIILAITAIVVIRLKSNKETTQNRVYHYDKEQAVNVQTDTLRLKNMNTEFSYSGIFEPNKETKISSDIQAKINVMLVDVGSIVKKGQALIQLDNSLLKLQLQSVEIQIEGLEADVKRYSVLAKADAIQGVQLEKAELGLKSAKVQQAILIEQINKTTIVSPFNGIVTAKLTEAGAFAAPGIPLLQITDISFLKFIVNVPENDLDQFLLNQIYTVSADVYPETKLSGKITMISSKANMGNSFPIHVYVQNTSDLKIKSGMFGKVDLKKESPDKQIIIPASAIVGSNIQAQVYKIESGKAMLQDVTVSDRIKNKVVITSGLKDGDIIVINGFINLFDGANVVIKN